MQTTIDIIYYYLRISNIEVYKTRTKGDQTDYDARYFILSKIWRSVIAMTFMIFLPIVSMISEKIII